METNIAPPIIIMTPINCCQFKLSPRNIKARIATKTKLILSIATTFVVSPLFKAKK